MTNPEEFITDAVDANLKDLVDKFMHVDMGPLEDLKQWMLEFALRIRQIRKLALYNYIEIDGVRYVKASELLMMME